MAVNFIGTDLDGFLAPTDGDIYVLEYGDTASTTSANIPALEFTGRADVTFVIAGSVYSPVGGVGSFTHNSLNATINVLPTGVISANTDGLSLNGDGATTVNNAGTVFADRFGISLTRTNVVFSGGSISNSGSVIAGDAGIRVTRNEISTINTGHVEGHFGYESASTSFNNRLENYGTIVGSDRDGAGGDPSYGIFLDLSFHSTVIVNAGSVSGTDGALKVRDDAASDDHVVNLTNSGVFHGDVSFAYGDDSYVAVGDGSVHGAVNGGGGDDTLKGGSLGDELNGDSGQDTLRGKDGDDLINGGTDEDYLVGGSGEDTLNGGDEDDTIIGGKGDDFIDGGDEDDEIKGGDDEDTLLGGDGEDTIYGGAGDDNIDGGFQDDDIRGGWGDDYIDGSLGDDILKGGNGEDTLLGDDGDDTIYGGAGDDYIDGGIKSDDLQGGSGDDTIVGGGGTDTINGGAGNDVLIGDGGADTIIGGSGDDTLTGGNGDDIFVFNFDSNENLITDFQDGADLIDLTAFGLRNPDFSSIVDPAITNAGGSTLLDLEALGGTGSILIEGLIFADADASDFIL